jgi:8-oxo-(d)GTP phosphatase
VSRVIPAAGGLVFRRTAKGKVKVLLVHRPKYNDWTLPKGHRERGELLEETALREVLEETGHQCRIVGPLTTTRHRVNGDLKEVAWFAMTPLPDSPGFKSNAEVDEVAWLTPKRAAALVSYKNDRFLIAGTDIEALSRTGTLRLVRHSIAGERGSWKGPDRERPLTKKGHREALALAELLAPAGIDRVVSSPFTRCTETVQPLAKAVGIDLETDEGLGEDRSETSATEVVKSLVGHNAVVSSHGGIIQGILRDLRKEGLEVRGPLYCSKSSIWEIQVEDGVFTTATYHPPPRV